MPYKLTYKERYDSDPEFKEKERRRGRDYYYRTRKLTGEHTGPKARSLEMRFQEKVDQRGSQECWPWLGASGNGTRPPTISDANGRAIFAYRVAYAIHYGDTDLPVRHICRNSWCMNPLHLFAGTMTQMAEAQAAAGNDEWLSRWVNERQDKKRQQVRAYYNANQEAIRRREIERQMRNKIRAVNYLGGSCRKCGFAHPSALQFHHRDPATKSFSITSKELSTPKKRPWDTVIVPELDKCELLCANCHFLHHSGLSAERVEALRAEI